MKSMRRLGLMFVRVVSGGTGGIAFVVGRESQNIFTAGRRAEDCAEDAFHCRAGWQRRTRAVFGRERGDVRGVPHAAGWRRQSGRVPAAARRADLDHACSPQHELGHECAEFSGIRTVHRRTGRADSRAGSWSERPADPTTDAHLPHESRGRSSYHRLPALAAGRLSAAITQGRPAAVERQYNRGRWKSD